MNTNMIWMTAQTPSAFGMPICGHVLVPSARATGENSALATTLVVRDRAVIAGTAGAVKTDRAFVPSYVPGTTAWSPPIC